MVKHNRHILSALKVSRKVPLRLVLVVPFVLQTLGSVGLVGYLAWRNGQQAVNDLAEQLISQTKQSVSQRLDTYLASPWQINQLNSDAIARGKLELYDTKTAGRTFWKQAKMFPGISYIGYYLTNGEGAGAGRWLKGHDLVITESTKQNPGIDITYEADAQGNRTRILERIPYSPFEDDWYSETVKAGQPIWSRIYAAEGYENYVAASANFPIYDSQQRLLGVFGVDLQLAEINQFLSQIRISPSSKIFIIERNGWMVANSVNEQPFKLKGAKLERISATESTDSLIQATAKSLQTQDLKHLQRDRRFDFTHNGAHQYVQLIPWRDQHGLDWLIVIAVPKSDFMARIDANSWNTFLLCLGSVGLAIALGIHTCAWITRPIHRLGQASQILTDQANSRTIQTIDLAEGSPLQELNVLSTSFNQMAAQLQTAFCDLATTNERLEQRVEERTTELRRAKEDAIAAEQVAESANHAKSEFLANMSHELRTPLNGILGYAQVLQQSAQLGEKDHKGVQVIYQCATHLLTMINDILDLSKIEACKLELYPTDFHLPSFLQGVVEICRIKAEQKSLDFHYEPSERLPIGIRADEKRLRQLLINLLSNAIKFTNQGSVTFRINIIEILDTTDSLTYYKLNFQIEDTGVGMAESHLEQIFLPFEQVGDSHKQSEGTGLGLAISQQIAALMDSQIQVKSELDKGSLFQFEVCLPESKDWMIVNCTLTQGMVKGYQGIPRKILIVDDRWENRSVLINLLEPIGFLLQEVTNGQEALDCFHDFDPDLVITDLAMPVMDGFELIQHLQQAELSLSIVVSSASVFITDQHKSLKAGANAFLAKPVQASELLEILAQQLELTWTYEQQPSPIPAQATSSDLIVAPDSDTLALLYDLTMQGMMYELIAHLDQLETSNSALIPFIQEIRQFAKRFQIQQIQTFIESFLEA
jgi:signal transduction histidine kinase/DNA-binding response OmpR family regulator